MAKQTFCNFLGKYNSSYKTYKIDKKNLSKFILSIKNFYEQIEKLDKKNEIPLKCKFNECVLSQFKYNTFTEDDRKDLTIKDENGKTTIIIEFKKPNAPKTEMLQISDENINKKALHETIWYFYKGRQYEKDRNIKHVIITDTEQFFFFDTKAFRNTKLEELCTKYEQRQLEYWNDTDKLYKDIQRVIDDNEINFDYSFFNLIEFKNKIINNTLDKNKHALQKLTCLYKALHPNFLFRNFSPKDSNELNAKFYNELLYILGLQEIIKNGKKQIVDSRQKGSLLDRIKNDLNCKNFNDSINLIIIWLNRILFLKLFEGQLVSFNNDTEFAFLNYNKIDSFNKLRALFFNILGKSLNERDNQNNNRIPYLNSSLFEPSPKESGENSIGNISDEVTLPLCKSSVLSKDKNYPKKPYLLQYLLDFLDAYDFSSVISEEENTKDIINSSVLGLIFEKLNGYKDGSVFTPAYITEYMAETAINEIIIRKYKEQNPNYSCSSIEDLEFRIFDDMDSGKYGSIKEWQKYYNSLLFDNLKICDPAVGSGHFLVSVLNYIIALKSKLKLLPQKVKIEVQNDTLVIYDKNIDTDSEAQFQYKRFDKETLEIQKLIFEEKRKVIENCLFGVDINKNSVEICRLRLWIELLKSTYYIDNTDEMQILPNIDINIKTGNSLISKYNVKVGSCALDQFKDKRKAEPRKIKDYKELVSKYKRENIKTNKENLYNQIENIKNEIFPTIQLRLDQDISTHEALKDSMEWMIMFPEVLDENGKFQGFDVIIANPPYMRVQEIQKTQPVAKDYYEKKEYGNYVTAHGSYELANLFIELGIRLSHKNSVNMFIFPHKFLNSSNGEYLREYLLANHYVDKLTHFGANMVFPNADTYTCIMQYSKQDNDGFLFRKFPFKSNFVSEIKNNDLFSFISYPEIRKSCELYGEDQWILFNKNAEYEILKKIYNSGECLNCIFKDIFQGIATSKDQIYILNKIQEDDKYFTLLMDNNKEYIVEKALFKPLLKGENVHKYETLKTNQYVFFPYEIVDGIAKVVDIENLKTKYPLTYKYVIDNEVDFKSRESKKAEKLPVWYAYIYPKNLNKFEQFKLSTMEICSKHPNVTINNKNLYHNTKVYSFIKNDNVNYDYKYLLAILNSNILWWFLMNTGDTLQGDARTMKKEYLYPFPLPVYNKDIENEICVLVDSLLAEKEKPNIDDNLCEQLEKNINSLVYKLYKLEPNEIEVIESYCK